MLHQSTSSIRAFSLTAANLSATQIASPASFIGSMADLEPFAGYHTVYNFEVEHFHTYIANGVRVHNKSVLDFLEPEELANIKDMKLSADGKKVDFVTVDIDNGNIEYEVGTRVSGSTISVIREMTAYDKNGNLYYKQFIEGPNGSIQVKNVSLTGQILGEDIGKSLSPFFANAFIGKDDSIFKNIAANTAMETVLSNLGEIMGAFVNRAAIDVGTFSIFENLKDITDASFLDFGGDATVAAVDSTITVINQLIIAEIFEGFELDGVEGAVLESLTAAGLNKVLRAGAGQLVGSNLFQNVLDSAGFSDASINTINEAFAGSNVLKFDPTNLIFSAIFNEIVPPIETLEGKSASVITNILVNFTKIAGDFGGPIGIIAGYIIGKIFDSLFGDDPEPRAFAKIGFDEKTGHFKILSSYSQDGGDEGLARSLAQKYVDGINGFVDTVMSNSNNYNEIGQWSIGHFMSSLKNAGKNGKTFADFQTLYVNSYVNTVADARHHDGQMTAVRAINGINVRDLVDSTSSVYGKILSATDSLQDEHNYKNYRSAVQKYYEALTNEFEFRMANDPYFIQIQGHHYLVRMGLLRDFINNTKMLNRSDFQSFLEEKHGGKVATEEEIFKKIGMSLTVADDYHRYLENRDEINTQIAMNPDSAFAAGWAATLLQAKQMGLGNKYTVNGDAIGNNIFTADGHDVVKGNGGDDDIRTYGGNDNIEGGDGNDRLAGGTGNDSIKGDAGNDRIIGSAGQDSIYGGAGIDTFDFSGMKKAASIDLTLNKHTGFASQTLIYEVENIIGGRGNDTLRGTGGANRLEGGGGNDILIASNGADTLIGGSGSDRVSYEKFSAGVVADLANEAVNSGGAAGDIYESVESLTGTAYDDTLRGGDTVNNLQGSAGDDYLDGRAGNDALGGGDGNDSLVGGAGADTMTGGSGNDAYWVDSLDDRVVETSGGGTDIIYTTISIGLTNAAWANVEKATLLGSAAGNLNGTAADNALVGNAAANTLKGYDGNDSLNGGAGADTLIGGNGDDAYWIDDAGDILTETATGGTDRIMAAISLDLTGRNGAYANVENVVLQGDGDLAAYGSADNNVFIGNTGDNILAGRAGNDSLTGAAGADTFTFNKAYDQDVILDFQDNIDTIRMLNFGVTNFTQAKTYATQSGAHVVFDFGAGDVLTVRNVTIAALQDDMVFV